MSFFWNTSPNNGGLSTNGTTYAVLTFGTVDFFGEHLYRPYCRRGSGQLVCGS